MPYVYYCLILILTRPLGEYFKFCEKNLISFLRSIQQSQKLPKHLLEQLLVVLVNDSVKCIFYLYKSKTKFIFYLKPLTVTDQLQRGSPRRVLTNQRRRNVGGVLHAHFTLHDTAIDPKITTLIAASNQKHGGGFLRGRIDQLGKLNRKNDFTSFNIMPTKLRVRATPTKTPLKEGTPGRGKTPRKDNSQENSQSRELKRLSRQTPANLAELSGSVDAAMGQKSYVTMIRLLINYTNQTEYESLKPILSTKNEVMQRHGGTDVLELEMKKQIIYHLLDAKSDENENFKHLTELMRWLTFSTSSIQMIGFFNEEVIPILIEYNHEQSIMRLVRAYNDLLILIPKSLGAYAPNETSSSDDDNEGDDQDHEDIVSLGRSSSIGASASSIYSNIFSNASR